MAPCQVQKTRLVADLSRPPAGELRVDRGRGGDLRKRAVLAGLVLALPFGDERIGPGEGVLEGAARRQRFLEEGAAEVGELVLVRAAERAAIVARGSDDERPVVAQRLDEAARVAR